MTNQMTYANVSMYLLASVRREDMMCISKTILRMALTFYSRSFDWKPNTVRREG